MNTVIAPSLLLFAVFAGAAIGELSYRYLKAHTASRMAQKKLVEA